MKITLEKAQERIAWWEMFRRVWERCDVEPGTDSPETAACKLFVRRQTVQGLRDALVKYGYRLPYMLKISELITKTDIQDREIQEVARALFDAHRAHRKIE